MVVANRPLLLTMTNVLVTGATGFIGRHLCEALAKTGANQLTLLVRKPLPASDPLHAFGKVIVTGELGPDMSFADSMQGADVLVHLASRVHVMGDQDTSAEALYQQTNVIGTRRMAEAAVAAGVKRFIFISSVKAVGERGFLAVDASPAPIDAYGRSKLAAERALHDVALGSAMAVTVLRPPLVYGPGVGANFLRLIRLVDRRIPLPLASVGNQRSLLYVGNLVSAIQRALAVEQPVTGSYFISDGAPVSTPDLIRAIAAPLLHACATVAGKQAELARLTESLVVDDKPFCEALQWLPPFTFAAGLGETIDWYSRQPPLPLFLK